MKWYKLRHDCKPDEGKYVLVSFLIGDERLLYNCVVAKLGENEYGDTSWDDGFNFYPIHSPQPALITCSPFTSDCGRGALLRLNVELNLYLH